MRWWLKLVPLPFWRKSRVIKEMMELDKKYPQYAFAKHKGYPTKLHLEKLAEFGVLPEYRRSFAPIKNY